MGLIFKRKLIKVGPASMAVVIPKEWLRYFETIKGKTVEWVTITEYEGKSGTLVIEPVFEAAALKRLRALKKKR